jgi:ribosomal protein S18 acetylase RimI-like enzyme
MFKELITDAELKNCTKIIRKSFKTAAAELGLTRKNAPTHPSFITREKIAESVKNGVKYTGFFKDDKLTGCIAIEKSDKQNIFYIERFCIIPKYRGQGYGKALLNNAFLKIKEMGGDKVSVAVIDEHKYIKQYYKNYGFTETGLKKFPHLPFTVCFMEKEVS